MSRLTLAVILIVIWILMWGEFSVANLVSGALVVAALYLVFPSSRAIVPQRRARPLATIHLIVYFLGGILVANLRLTVAVLGRRSQIRQGFVDVPVCIDDPGLVTLMVTMTALTPGSMVVRSELSPPTVRVHGFGRTDPMQVAANFRRLEELCILAFGDRTERSALVARDGQDRG